jgi:Glycosyl hydrolase family 63 C-terminal domain/Glycosyl hydrolase family 63 N-terminal domain
MQAQTHTHAHTMSRVACCQRGSSRVASRNACQMTVLTLLFLLSICAHVIVVAHTDDGLFYSDSVVSSSSDGPARYRWGTYRPNVYVGVRARVPQSPLIGMMWHDVDRTDSMTLHHDCDERDKLRRYGWRKHNGRSFGQHEILDSKSKVNITTEFVQIPAVEGHVHQFDEDEGYADSESWVMRVYVEEFGAKKNKNKNNKTETDESVPVRPPRNVSLFWYLADEHRAFDIDPATLTSQRPPHAAQANIDLIGTPRGKPSALVPPFHMRIRSMEGSAPLRHPLVPDDDMDDEVDPDDDDAAGQPANEIRYLGVNLPKDNGWNVKPPVENALGNSVRASLTQRMEGMLGDAFAAEQDPYKRRDMQRRALHRAKSRPVVARLPNRVDENSNLWVFQHIVSTPAVFEIVFTERRPVSSNSAEPGYVRATDAPVEYESKNDWLKRLDTDLETERVSEFLRYEDAKFETQFAQQFPQLRPETALQAIRDAETVLDDANTSDAEREELQSRITVWNRITKKGYQNMCRAALSNMIGGMGYFHGTSLVQRTHDTRPEIMRAQSLLTSVPSRSFFPRGFMWDEGFHQLLVSHFDADLSREVLQSWASLIEETGWLPREQILGGEARSRVPAEFQVQKPWIANPPTQLLAIKRLVDATASLPSDSHDMTATTEFLQRVFPALHRHTRWFLRTQHSALPGMFRWHERTDDHCLASGLDDYPRASVLIDSEAHVDLHSWMILLCDLMRDVAKWLADVADRDEMPADKDAYLQLSEQFGTQGDELRDLLDANFWNEDANMYCDYYVNTTSGTKHFVEHFGYVSLFPFMLNLVPPSSPKLEHVLDKLADPNMVWSNGGIRSLSKSDSQFGTKENYWRGPIWFNMNYLITGALYNYGHSEALAGPFSVKARTMYNSLRDNLTRNIFREFRRTGYLWEQYNATTGKGQKSHPFTGWTSLIVLVFAEQY